MGVDIVTWRARMGKAGIFAAKGKHVLRACSFMRINSPGCVSVSIRLSLAIALLLFMAGVELNPGPTFAELSTLINNLLATVTAASRNATPSSTCLLLTSLHWRLNNQPSKKLSKNYRRTVTTCAVNWINEVMRSYRSKQVLMSAKPMHRQSTMSHLHQPSHN